MSPRVSRQRIATTVAGAGFFVALLSLVFGGFLEVLFDSAVSLDRFDIVRAALPLVGLVVIVAVVREMRKPDDNGWKHDMFADKNTPEMPHAREKVGAETEQRLSNAVMDWYQCESTYSVSEIQDTLVTSAVRVIKTRHGLDENSATDAIEQGEWTEDPIAAAFLSPQLPQPLRERLRGALDPGAAFYRRVERTITAIETLEQYQGVGDIEIKNDSQTTIYQNAQSTSATSGETEDDRQTRRESEAVSRGRTASPETTDRDQTEQFETGGAGYTEVANR